jgi:argininosuccinate lyase
MVRDLASRGADFSSLSPADWKAYDALFDEDVLKWITPEAAVRNRRTPQSTNPARVAEMLKAARARL